MHPGDGAVDRHVPVELPACISVGLQPGHVFVPFHWGDLYGEGNALNYLTVPAFGPVEKQPELKFCAVNVAKVRASTRMELQLSEAK